jgi:hypothetical protein
MPAAIAPRWMTEVLGSASNAPWRASKSGRASGVGWNKPRSTPGAARSAAASSSLCMPPPFSLWRPYSAAAQNAAAIAPAELPPTFAKRYLVASRVTMLG